MCGAGAGGLVGNAHLSAQRPMLGTLWGLGLRFGCAQANVGPLQLYFFLIHECPSQSNRASLFSSASLGLINYLQVDMLGPWYKFINS